MLFSTGLVGTKAVSEQKENEIKENETKLVLIKMKKEQLMNFWVIRSIYDRDFFLEERCRQYEIWNKLDVEAFLFSK